MLRPPVSSYDVDGALSTAAIRLITARSEEASLAIHSCKHPDDEVLYAQWAQARQRLEECQSAYVECVARAGYPDVPIRAAVEREAQVSR